MSAVALLKQADQPAKARPDPALLALHQPAQALPETGAALALCRSRRLHGSDRPESSLSFFIFFLSFRIVLVLPLPPAHSLRQRLRRCTAQQSALRSSLRLVSSAQRS